MKIFKFNVLSILVFVILGALVPFVFANASSYPINNVPCGHSSEPGYTTALCNAHILINNNTPLAPGGVISSEFWMDWSGYSGLIGGPNIVRFNGDDGLMNDACGNNCKRAWSYGLVAPMTNGCYSVNVYYEWSAWANPAYGGGPYTYNHVLPYQVGNVNCSGGNTGGGVPNDNYHIPSVSISAQNPSVTIGGNTNINWQSSDAAICTVKDDTGYVLGDGISGSINTGSLTQTTTYTATCQGSLIAFGPIKNNFAKEQSLFGKIKENILSFIPRALADLWQPPDNPPVVSASVTVFVTTPTPVVSLNLKPDQEKDLIKKGSPDLIGQTHLEILVKSLPSGSCTLKNTTNGLSYNTYFNNNNFQYKDVSNLQNDSNDFQLQCTDSTLNTPIVNVKTQSGTLNSTNPSCTILVGQSSCTIPTNWTTINPNPTTGITTEVVNLYNNSVIYSNTGTSGNNPTTTISGAVIPVGSNFGEAQLISRNKVDGENTGTTVTNTLSNLTVDVYCATGSNWNGTVCFPNVVNRPDLISSAITPTTAVAGTARNFSSTITNQGNANTNYEGISTFTNLFQRASFLDDANQPIPDGEYAVSGMGILGVNGGTAITSRSINFATAGTYYLRVCADKSSASNGGTINESNEGNNCHSPWTTIIVTDIVRPDLTASVTTPTSAVMGVGRTYTASILNQGTASTGLNFFNRFETATGFDDPTSYLGPLNPLYYTTGQMAILAAGASSEATSPTITFTSTSGNHYMRACADFLSTDPNGRIVESNENNNCGPWSLVEVQASPTINLMASNPTQTTATIGTPMNFTSYITNSGNTTTGGSFNNIFQIAEQANGGGFTTRINSTPSPMPTLGPSGLVIATSVSHTFTGSPTTRSVRACADMNSSGVGQINELPASNELNNCSDWVNITFPSTTGTLTASNCQIPSGESSCKTILNWNTINPVSGGNSAVTTTPDNTIVRTGLSGTNFPYSISPVSRTFYLYHTPEVLLDQATATATCALLTDVWVNGKCSPAAQVYTVTASAGLNGNISPSTQTVTSGQTTTFTVTPNSGYTATMGGTCPAGNLVGTTYTTGAIVSNCTVRADFSLSSSGMTGTLSANPSPCIIAEGASSCTTTLTWGINKTEAIPSAITAAGMTDITLLTPTIGGNYTGTKTATVPYPSRNFYLYNNNKSLVPISPVGHIISGPVLI